jgi:hypothetical protein
MHWHIIEEHKCNEKKIDFRLESKSTPAPVYVILEPKDGPNFL